jgi:fibronectin-binding autotransporter adhesin
MSAKRKSDGLKGLVWVAGLAILLVGGARSATAAIIWNAPLGGSWNSAGNWNPATIPNAVGANATFNGAATANNPAQTGNRTVTVDAAQTVGSIVFNNDLSTFTNSLTAGTAGSLTFDETGAGPATITVPAASGTGNNTISAPMTLVDNLVAQVDQVTASSAAGALNLTATIGGAGGFIKQGDGLVTFGTGAKTYTGPTILSGGRMRMSSAARAQSTSSFTINAGGQLDLISASSYTLGGPLILNGSGATSGPFAVFPGAIRNDTGLVVTITNAVTLQTNTLIHVQATAGTGSSASPTGSMTFSGTISGPGKLTFTAPNSNIDQGSLILTGANTYTGGTLVAGGILEVSGATANLGTGNVTVDNASSTASIARLSIDAGVLDAIADNATLSLAGGGTAGVADQNFAILGAGVNDVVGGLVLGGVTQNTPGTYGSTASTAMFQNDEFFSGPGVVTLAAVPEPASLSLLALGALQMCARRWKVSRA